MAQINVSRYTNPRYENSSSSDVLAVGTLPTPSIRRVQSGSEGIIAWDAVDGASFYDVYKNNVKITSVSRTEYRGFKPSKDLKPGESVTDTYYIQAFAKVEGNLYYSGKSNDLTFEYHKINNPVISYKDVLVGQVVESTTVQYANKYDLYVAGKLYRSLDHAPTSLDELGIDLTDNYYGTFEVYMIASNTTDPCLYISSEGSNKLSYTYLKLSDPVLEYTPDPATIQWTAIDNADVYEVYLNDKLYSTTGKPNFVFTGLPAGSYNTFVIAKNNKMNDPNIKYPNPKYVNSDKSNIITFGTLATPVISIEDNLISWDNVNNAQYYIIYNYGVEIDRVSTNSYRLYHTLDNRDQFYSIQVRAAADGNITDSELSNTITYIIDILNTPMNVLYDVHTRILTWNSVENADYYDVMINGVVKYSTKNISETLILETGENIIYVIAKSYKYEHRPSPLGIPVKINNPSRERYVAKIETSKGVYEDFTIELPFNFKTTKDETLDTGSCSLLPIDRKEPFEAYTNISIFIYPENDIQNSLDRIPFYPFPIHMLVASDEVEEIQIGTGSRFRHNISLIERTKLLETEILPNLAVTQPESFIREIYKPKKDIIVPDMGTNKRFLSTDYFACGRYSIIALLYNQENFSWISGFKNESLIGSLTTDYKENSIIPLPYEKEEYITYNNLDIYEPLSVIPIPKAYEQHIPLGRRHYKYRLHSNAYGVDPDKPEYEIISTNSNVQQYWNTEKMNIQPGQYYDIILEIDPVKKPSNLYDGTKIEGIGGNNNEYINFMIDKNAVYKQTPIITNIFKDMFNLVNVVNLNLLKPYRIVWKNIYIYEQSNVVTPEETIKSNKLAYRVVDGIQKLLDNTKLKVYDGKNWTDSKYELDPNIYNKFKGTYDVQTGLYTGALMSPELKFENGKSLFEALSVYGKLINGIPRLGIQGEEYPSNIITFDALKPEEYEVFREDTNELEDIGSSMENHTTGFVSSLSNIVSDESWTMYPSDGGFISPRSTSESDPYVTRDNMGIVVDQPIYRIIDVFITNFDKDQPNKVQRITSDVLESTIFQALSNSAIGKGRAVYYKKGDNKIYGLGIIPQASEFYATLGWSEDKYVIQNILKTRGYASELKDVNEYQYKVIYVPIMDSRIYTEQSNISDMRNYTYKNFNQEDNVISDHNFGESANTAVSRLGNNTITKTYKAGTFVELPKIGNIKSLNGYNYYADEVNYEFHNNYVEATVAYSKNWNKINERVGIPAEYRLYEIYADDYLERDINLNSYCYLSVDNYNIQSKLLSNNALQNIANMINSGNNTSKDCTKPDTAYIRILTEDPDGFVRDKYIDYFGDKHQISAIALPIHKYNFKNSVALIAKMKDNYSAGINAVDLYYQKYAQKDVRYCDEYGRTNVVGFTICNPDVQSLEHKMFINTGDPNIKPTLSKNNIPYNRACPSVKYYNNTDVPGKIGNITLNTLLKVNKDNREALSFVYQLHFQTFDKRITIHNGLTSRLWNKNEAFTTYEKVDIKSPSYYLYVGDGSKTSNINEFAFVKNVNIPTVTFDGKTIIVNSCTGTPNDTKYDGYCLAWPNGDIIYSVKEKLINNSSLVIPNMYLNFSDDKIDFKSK